VIQTSQSRFGGLSTLGRARGANEVSTAFKSSRTFRLDSLLVLAPQPALTVALPRPDSAMPFTMLGIRDER
jgi:hypothetical protein